MHNDNGPNTQNLFHPRVGLEINWVGYNLESNNGTNTQYLFYPRVGLEINWVGSNLESNNGPNTQYLFHPLSWITNQLGGLQYRKQQW